MEIVDHRATLQLEIAEIGELLPAFLTASTRVL
jgi:hypothetical protein